jgi:hypothetical protein
MYFSVFIANSNKTFLNNNVNLNNIVLLNLNASNFNIDLTNIMHVTMNRLYILNSSSLNGSTLFKLTSIWHFQAAQLFFYKNINISMFYIDKIKMSALVKASAFMKN